MNADAILAALDLPVGSRVDRRVPKKLVLENGAPTAADKRQINDGIEELFWLAALKPTTIGVPAYKDEAREYLEIAVVRLALRPKAKALRLVELVHRAIPYPLLLIADQAGGAEVSAAHKRWAQNEAGKTVLDGAVIGAALDTERDEAHRAAFQDALALGRQPRATLYALYNGWIDALVALKAARVTGAFKPTGDPVVVATRHEALGEIARLEAEVVRLRAAGKKEKQMARQVELNLELKRVEAALEAAHARL